MATINVNRNLSDQFYRYKMPKLTAKVEGKGNGIKTVIVNMVDIAKALNRPPMYPTKYFGCILGAQVNSDLKNERYIVNGAHEAAKLQDLLDGFIQKYVLCPSCENPETVLGVNQRKGTISTTCKACGYNGLLNAKDKLATYILKYPPNHTVTAGASVSTAKKSKRKMKEEQMQNGGERNGNGSPHNDSDELENGHDDEDWCEDTNPDAVAKRMEELSMGAKGLMLNDDLEKPQEERLAIFFEFIKKKRNGSEGPIDVTLQKEIVAEAERLDIRNKAVIVLCELLFDDASKVIQQIKNQRFLFLRFTAGNEKAQKYLLRGFELTIKLYQKELMQRVPHILKMFYDYDILEENVLLEWGAKSVKKAGKDVVHEMKEKAAPFLKWLQEAEEEESSEGDEEEEVEVVYDDRARSGKIQAVDLEEPASAKSAKASAPARNEPEDIDIDAI